MSPRDLQHPSRRAAAARLGKIALFAAVVVLTFALIVLDARAGDPVASTPARAADAGIAFAFGPVADPKDGWGVGIIAVTDDDELHRLQSDDPAMRANIGMRYEAYPMPTVIVGSSQRHASG